MQKPEAPQILSHLEVAAVLSKLVLFIFCEKCFKRTRACLFKVHTVRGFMVLKSYIPTIAYQLE